MCVRWHNKGSDSFTVSDGTRQSSIFIHISLPGIYVICGMRYFPRELVVSCHIGGRVINVLAYTDDFIVLGPSWFRIQHLLDVLEAQTHAINMTCNIEKTVCMVAQPKRRDRIVSNKFPLLTIGVNSIQFVSEFK